MISKLEVRKRIVLLEQKIKEEKHNILMEINKMRDACTTPEMKAIFHESKEYIRLHTRLDTLHEVLNDIIDMRCEEMFEN